MNMKKILAILLVLVLFSLAIPLSFAESESYITESAASFSFSINTLRFAICFTPCSHQCPAAVLPFLPSDTQRRLP